MGRSYGYIPRRRCAPTTELVSAVPPPTAEDNAFDITRLSLEQRLALAERFVAAHPGRPVTAMLLDLFPELRLLVK